MVFLNNLPKSHKKAIAFYKLELEKACCQIFFIIYENYIFNFSKKVYILFNCSNSIRIMYFEAKLSYQNF